MLAIAIAEAPRTSCGFQGEADVLRAVLGENFAVRGRRYHHFFIFSFNLPHPLSSSFGILHHPVSSCCQSLGQGPRFNSVPQRQGLQALHANARWRVGPTLRVYLESRWRRPRWSWRTYQS